MPDRDDTGVYAFLDLTRCARMVCVICKPCMTEIYLQFQCAHDTCVCVCVAASVMLAIVFAFGVSEALNNEHTRVAGFVVRGE